MEYLYPQKLSTSYKEGIAFLISQFKGGSNPDNVEKLNYYSILWVKKGDGSLTVDFSEYAFRENSIMFFSPFQPFMLSALEELSGIVIHFHTDFFCLEKHKKEVSCDGILFNNIYHPPFIELELQDVAAFENCINNIATEMQGDGIAKNELIVAYLKILIINASRIKALREPNALATIIEKEEPAVLSKFKDAVELYYKSKHTPAQYADLLNVTPKLLGKLTKNYFNKTTTELIQERIIIEAKRELYLTQKTVKEIASELGFEDAYYFSRLFKKYAQISPQFYREKITQRNQLSSPEGVL